MNIKVTPTIFTDIQGRKMFFREIELGCFPLYDLKPIRVFMNKMCSTFIILKHNLEIFNRRTEGIVSN